MTFFSLIVLNVSKACHLPNIQKKKDSKFNNENKIHCMLMNYV